MARSLEDMTLQELWQLFPIQLAPHRDVWAQWYAEEAERLTSLIPAGDMARINHIGSTSVPEIWAKPIVDILAELNPSADMSRIAAICKANGWREMCHENDRISLNQGYTIDGFAERVFHLHLRRLGDCDELYFRDILREKPALAKEYEELKLRLWKQYEHDRDAYTQAKTAFIQRFTQVSKRMHAGLYD